MRTPKKLRIRTASDNSIKTYIDKSQKYKGFQRLKPIHKILEEVRQEGKPIRNYNINFSERRAISKLSDGRGSLSRFTKIRSLQFPSYSYLVQFLEAGGRIDQVSGWGYSISQLIECEAKIIEPTTLVYLFNYPQRTDYGNYEAIIWMLENGLMPRDKKEYSRNYFIYERISLLINYGLEWNRSLLSLGFLSQNKFNGYILDNVSHETFMDTISKHQVNHFARNYDEDGNFCKTTPLAYPKTKLGKKRLNDIFKYLNRKRLRRLMDYKGKTTILSKSAKATAYLAKMYCDKTKDKNTFLGFRSYNYSRVKTSVGDIANILHLRKDGYNTHLYLDVEVSRVGLLIQIKHERRGWDTNRTFILHKARRIKDYWVCQIDKIWFVWKDDFIDHMEATSLKDAFEKIEKRRKKDNLILCFNDVRNDRTGTAGYCISGTKSFLQNRMLFAYRLLAAYQNWSDVPSEIMELDFHLADKSIFNGYPSPVR